MVLKIFLSVFVMLLNIQVFFSQNKNDYIWLFGRRPYNGVKKNGNIVDFNKNRKIDSIILGDGLGDNNAIISDGSGKLLFYYGGCSVVDSTHNIMENGDSINYGESWEYFCLKGGRVYPGWLNSIILPDPGNDENKNGYYLIHKRVEKLVPFTDTYTPELYYTYVDMKGNNGKGTVIRKDHPIFRTTNIVDGYVSACKHANGRDWWLIQMKKNTNIYFKILLTKDTIMAVDSQSMGPNFTKYTCVGQAVFSPDGSKWVMYGDLNGSMKGNGGALVYDFDRETGLMSNMQFIETRDSGRISGVAISPNSRYAYISATYDMYQIDLKSNDIQGSLTHIAHWDGFHENYKGTGFSFAQLAPDCKIYVVAASYVSYIHVINKPDEKGISCDFIQHAIKFPFVNDAASIPNFPHFRIDEDQICDPTITSLFGETIWYRRDLEVFPNPSSGVFNIKLPDMGPGKLVVTDLTGQNVLEKVVSNVINEEHIDMFGFPDGSYFIEFWPDKSEKSIFYGSKIFKVR